MNINHDHDDLDPLLAQRFSKLRVIPARNPERATAGRLAFLKQGRELAQKNPPTVPVSPASRKHPKGWMPSISEYFTRKQMRPVFTKVMAAFIAIVLVFGGAAVTAYASQGSLPTDALYGVKTFGEDLQLRMAPHSDDKLGLALEFAQRRVDEMAALNRLGMIIPEHAATQYQEQVEYTLRLAAGLSDEHITAALILIRIRLQEQLSTLDQLSKANPNDAALIRAREELRDQLQFVEAGLQDPQQYRVQMLARERQAQETQAPFATEAPDDPMVTPEGGNNNANINGNTNGNLAGNENGNENMNGNGNEDANSNVTDNDNDGNGNDGNSNDGNGNGNDDDHGGNGNDNDDDKSGNGNDNRGNGNDNGGDGNDNDNGGSGNGNGRNGNDNDNGGNGGNGNGHG